MKNLFVSKTTYAVFACVLVLFGASVSPFATAAQNENSSGRSVSQNKSQSDLWRKVAENDPKLENTESRIDARKHVVYRVDKKSLLKVLNSAPLEFTGASRGTGAVLEIPTPDGGFARFFIEDSPILAPEIAAQFPSWKTFQGRGIDDPTATARFDVNMNGFHGYVIGANGTYLINPRSDKDQENYIVYYKNDLASERDQFSCKVEKTANGIELFGSVQPVAFSNGAQLRNFRLAVSASKQYTNFFNGDKNSAFAAIQTSVNRMITIYRRELAATFTIVSGTNTIFNNADDGGFTNNSSNDTDKNQEVLDRIIGNANYDIGHVVSVTPNPDGLAQSPSLCSNRDKAQGFTGSPNPVGDGYDVDYLAHEIGHQFGMSHTFNNNADGSCSTREQDSAFEPASGVTIMGYAGICAPRNLSANSIEFFHARSFVQSLEYMSSIAACGTTTATGNTAPANVSAGPEHTIPKQTPFVLTASAQDSDPTLTYSWEEYDLGAPTNSQNSAPVDTDEDGTARPVFRSYRPSASPSRVFPSLHYILNNANTPPLTYTGQLPLGVAGAGYTCAPGETCITGERLPSITRTMNFRVTVRDNNPNGGGVADAVTKVNVDGASGPFIVTTQNTPAAWQGGSRQTVTWDVANTNNAPISAANVKISLSTDGGKTFPIVLAASTANDGSEQITVPNNATSTARIKIEAVGNIFFDINNADFTITAAPAQTGKAPADFDGDGKTDISVFRPSNGVWYMLNSGSGAFGASQFGQTGDKIVPADFDGDGKTDVAVYRGGTWFLLRSAEGFAAVQFGTNEDIPVPGDFDGDRKADVAVFRPSNGVWYMLQSTGGFRAVQFGAAGDKPVIADFDGDGKTDITVFRPESGVWFYLRSSDGGFAATQFGANGDMPVSADFDGDGKNDIAVFRPSNGVWYYLRSSDGGFAATQFGTTGDQPTPGDFDGDGKTDFAVYRPSTGTWFLLQSTGGFKAVQFGTNGDIAAPSAFVR